MGIKNLLIISVGLIISFSGCSKKMPVALPGSNYGGATVLPGGDSGSVDSSLNGNVVPTEAKVGNQKNVFQAGKVNNNGKYLGTDGLSKSGFKMLYFASDSYTLDDDQIQRLMSDLPKIKETAKTNKLLVEGNCDEFGTDEYNHALGLKRAKAVKALLVNSGIDANRIDIVSYGESNPICTINKPACHAKNRRVEINKI